MFSINLFVAFVLTIVFIRLIMRFAKPLGLEDLPNGRSSHTKITPRGAGIGFGFAFFLTILIFDFTLFAKYWFVFLALALVFVVGILDDHKNASPKQKFYVVFLATALLYFNDIGIYSLGGFFGFELNLWYFALPFTMFAIAGFTNALNLIDGIDGLAATVSIVILSLFWYIGYRFEDQLILTLCSVSLACLFAFLLFNCNPAKIFMGDSGSLFLGFLISTVACLSSSYIHPVAILYLVAIPVVDTLIVMIRRARRGTSPLLPDKTHIHHILLKFFAKKVNKTVFFIVLMQGLSSLAGLMLSFNSKAIASGPIAFLALVAFIGIVVIFYMIFTGMKRRQRLIERLAQRRKRATKAL